MAALFDTKEFRAMEPWFLELPMIPIRTKACQTRAITYQEKQTLEAMEVKGPQTHNAKLLAMVRAPGTKEAFKRLAEAVKLLGDNYKPKYNQMMAIYDLGKGKSQAAQAPRQEQPPLQLHVQPQTEAQLPPADPAQQEANLRPPLVCALDDRKSGRVQAATESIRHDALNATLVFEGYHSSSSGGDESTIKWMSVFVIRDKCHPVRINAVLATLRRKFDVPVEGTYVPETQNVTETYVESCTARKESYDKAMTTVDIVVRVDKPVTKQIKQEVTQRIKSSLRKCGVELHITCVDSGSVIIYALLSVTDLIRLYSIAASYPGVLAGLGILELGTLGRDTRFSFRPSRDGPDSVPLDSSTAKFVRDMSPPGAVEEILGEANVHYVVRELLSRLQPDGPTLERVLQWLEAHALVVDPAEQSQAAEARRQDSITPVQQVFDTPGGREFHGWCLRLGMDSFRNQALTSGAITFRQQTTLMALASGGPEVHNAKLLAMVAERNTVDHYRALAETVNALGHRERYAQFMALLQG